jgi:hypothetical protein
LKAEIAAPKEVEAQLQATKQRTESLRKEALSYTLAITSRGANGAIASMDFKPKPIVVH